MATSSPTYKKPGLITKGLVNPLMVAAMHLGVSIWGARILEVRGRKSGAVRRAPVNLLSLGGHEYLVAPRGDTQWARNARAAGTVALVLGRKRDERKVTELGDDEKVPVLRAYLKKWKFEVGAFFEGVSAGSSDEDLRRTAPQHPVFLLSKPEA